MPVGRNACRSVGLQIWSVCTSVRCYVMNNANEHMYILSVLTWGCNGVCVNTIDFAFRISRSEIGATRAVLEAGFNIGMSRRNN